MPTGYTYKVEDGTITELNEFVWTCAKGMGAFLHMRDDNSPLIKRPKVSSYYQKRLEDTQKELSNLLKMSDEDKISAVQKEYVKNMGDNYKHANKHNQHNKYYNQMMTKVEAWDPPTSNHQGLKKFMLGQLELSIDPEAHYIRPKRPSADEWHKNAIQEAKRNYEYAEIHLADDHRRIDGFNQWIDQLEESLPIPDSMKG